MAILQPSRHSATSSNDHHHSLGHEHHANTTTRNQSNDVHPPIIKYLDDHHRASRVMRCRQFDQFSDSLLALAGSGYGGIGFGIGFPSIFIQHSLRSEFRRHPRPEFKRRWRKQRRPIGLDRLGGRSDHPIGVSRSWNHRIFVLLHQEEAPHV